MYFYCVSHDKCLNPNQVNTLKREFMAELQHQVTLATTILRVRPNPDTCLISDALNQG